MQNELQGLAGKIGELEQEADEHTVLAEEPDRKCFRLIGGVLVERTVKDVAPTLQSNKDNVRVHKEGGRKLTEQYKTREEEFDTFKREYNIRPAART
ncbi:hypothetical protein B0H14DRAFT_2965572 [Mycena olivaceomarginata]|nr:hypothetical protein B0H14DRAFT_2965572 [Mycena olivaceomarginata]